MRIKSAQVSLSRTVNLDNFENAKLSIVLEIEADDEDGEVSGADLEEAWSIAKDEIREEAKPLLEARRRIRSKRWAQVLGGLPKELRDVAEQVLQESQSIEEEQDHGDQDGSE
jgi:hypothetical protein